MKDKAPHALKEVLEWKDACYREVAHLPRKAALRKQFENDETLNLRNLRNLWMEHSVSGEFCPLTTRKDAKGDKIIHHRAIPPVAGQATFTEKGAENYQGRIINDALNNHVPTVLAKALLFLSVLCDLCASVVNQVLAVV